MKTYFEYRAFGACRPKSRYWGVVLAVSSLAIAGCSGGPAPSASQKYSPRVVAFGQSVPKGGGRHKLGKPYVIKGVRYVPRHQPGYDRVGIASWYGDKFHGRLTANGEVYDMDRLTAAHPTLPLPSLVKVTNLTNGRQVVVRVNDRGPYAKGRLIDLSRAAAKYLGMHRAGTGRVRVQYLGAAPLNGNDSYERRFAYARHTTSSASRMSFLGAPPAWEPEH